MTAELHRYAVEHSDSDPLLRELAEETEALGGVAVMMMAPEQGALTTLLVRAIGARRALEIGTFTGYGAISIVRGLPEDGHLLGCDVSEEWAAIARRYFERAGLADRIELRIAPALETLRGLDPADPFDFCFIDADKESYPAYYEEALAAAAPRRPGDDRQRLPRRRRRRCRERGCGDTGDPRAERPGRGRRSRPQRDDRRRGRDHPGAEALARTRLAAVERQEWLALGTRGMAATFGAFARSAGAEVIERDGVFAILNPAVAERSVFNSVVYSDPAGLAAARDELAAAYAERGCAWTVWVPEHDRGTAALLAAAGHRLDAEPRAMGAPLSAFAEPDLEGLEWTDAAEIEVAGALNDAAYGYPEGTWLRGIGPRTEGLRTYLARVGGEPASTVAVRYDGW